MAAERRAKLAPAAIAMLLMALAGCQPPLPERETPVGQLYLQKCGQCHVPYNPRTLTPAMWSAQVKMMEGKMRQAGLPPLSEDQEKAITDYLVRNSGAQ